MESTKLILLFCPILVSFCKGEQTFVADIQKQSNQLLEPSSISHNYGYFRRVNRRTNSLHQCFCFLQRTTGSPVTKKLNPNGETLERLVVYLYKDASSNEIKIYLPNYEKQLMIPDLVLDEGDILEPLPSSDLEIIFSKHSYLVTNHRDIEIPDIAQIIDPESFNSNRPGLVNIIKASNIIPFDNEENPTTSKDTLIYSDDVNNEQLSNIHPQQPDILNENEIDKVEDDDENISEELDVTLAPQITNNITENEIKNINQVNQELNQSPEDLNNITEDGTEQRDQEPENVDVMPENHHLNHEADVFNTLPNDNIEPYGLNNVQDNQNQQPNINIEETTKPNQVEVFNVLPNLQSEEILNPIKVTTITPDTVEHTDYVTWQELTDSSKTPTTNNPINTYSPPYIIINKLKPKDINTPISIDFTKKIMSPVEQKVLNKVPIQQANIWYNKLQNPHDMSIFTLHPNNLIKKYYGQRPNGVSEISFHDTFDNWLNQQLEKVQFADSEASNSIDIYTFKYLIEKTLRKIGFFIAENGVLVDSNGVELDTANLVLRPILIGNSVQYQKLLKGKVGTFKLPTDLPYLEAVLITSIKPQKILGIIPLGKTYLPKRYRTPLSLYIGDAAQGECNRCDVKKLFLANRTPPGNSPELAGRFLSWNRPKGWKASRSKLTSPKTQRYGVHRIVSRPFQISRTPNQGTKSSRRVFPFDQINTIIDRVYKVPLIQDEVRVINTPQTYVLDYNPRPLLTAQTIPTVPILKLPVGFKKATPGFRIIGGNAATSSGTPVNSRGRSGIDPEDLTNIDVE